MRRVFHASVPAAAFLAMVCVCGCSQPSDEALSAAMARYELTSPAELASVTPIISYGRDARATFHGRDARATSDAAPAFVWLGVPLSMTETIGEKTDNDAGGEPDASADKTPAADKTPGADRTYVPWRERRGPAYEGDFWHSFGRDAKEFIPLVWDDTKATARSPFAWTMFAAAGVTGIALSGNRGNDQVADHFTRHGSQLNKFWDNVGDVGGNPGTHFAFAGALYLTSLAREDDKNYEAAKSLLSALSINGLATMALKVAARTESPNGDEFGWPSGHTSSSFCFAAVMYEHYGPWVGVPLYAFAAFVGYERIDARNHDFNDVISGALIGMAIGHIVAQNHQPKVLGMDIVPYADPRGGAGIALMKQW